LKQRYSRLDRFLHRAAFSNLGLQKSAADIEDRLYARRLCKVDITAPVFVTALPRAGTTILLEALAAAGNFAVHTYRHMPFLLTPMLWHAFARRFQVEGSKTERAHGDGIEIGFDSPEAFEEVAWRAFWPQKYLSDRIETWSDADEDSYGEFDAFFKSHIAKMIALRSAPDSGNVRYLSKNNANIARIPILAKLFSDSIVLVVFRNPVDHAASMLRQHVRFREIHASQPFARRYMADIGHYEFGMNRRPLNFPRTAERSSGKAGRRNDVGSGNVAAAPAMESLERWLAYWCDAYEHVLAGSLDRVLLVSYDSLCEDSRFEFRRIAVAAGCGDPGNWDAVARRFRPPTRYPDMNRAVSADLLARAVELHRRLLRLARRESGSPGNERGTSAGGTRAERNP